MRIDLHIHTSTGSDGSLTVEQVFPEAKRRGIGLMSITDHDSIAAQEKAIALAEEHGIAYISGVELNVAFTRPDTKPVSLDFLGYGYDVHNRALQDKLALMRRHREKRARLILQKLNAELARQGIPRFTDADIGKIEESADGALGRPHIANRLIEKGIVASKQEAFDRYLVRCDAPKYPLSLPEASRLIGDAGGRLVLAHPNDPNGTSLVRITADLASQEAIIERYMLQYIHGVECWHSRHDARTTAHYIGFAERHHLLMTGGSDCHQKPTIMGTMDIPDWVAEQFK